MMKKILLILLCSAMLLGIFGGCKKSNEGSQSEISDSVTTNDLKTPSRGWEDLPKTDYNGKEYLIYGRGGAGTWNTVDLQSAEDKTVLQSAVKQRTSAVEMRHGVTVKVNLATGNAENAIAALSLAEVNDYALYSLPTYVWSKMVLKGYFKDLRSVDLLNFEDQWWNQGFINDLTLYNQLYGIIGDATYIDKESTWCVFFNKDIISSYGLDNPYELVETNAWTIAKMKEMALEFAQDVNGDGKMELADKDRYGIIGEVYNIDILLQACGIKIVSYADNDLHFIANDKTSFEIAETVCTSIYDLVAESKLTYLAQKHTGAWALGRDFFRDQQALFHLGGIVLMNNYFRYFPSDYGIIPVPKFNEEQKNYYCGITTLNATVMCIPRNGTDIDMSATVMQALSAKGKDTLMPVYYNTVLKGQATRDSESYRMLDLIFESRTFDLSTIYSVGGLSGSGSIAYLAFNEKKGEFTSTINGNIGNAEKHINEIIAYYDKNYKG